MSTHAPDDLGAPGPAEARSGEPSERTEDEDQPELTPSEMEPRDFWEDHNAKRQLARFDSQSGGMQTAQAMPMLVAVRLRPMWEKEQEAGDYNCIQILDGKVVIVLDPWYDPELNKNREREKRYAFDKVFDEQVGQDDVYQETAHGLVGGVLDGFNASVFAYGATGAGKTHTMLGAIDQPGVMVTTLYDMFTRMQTDDEFADKKFKVTLSYLEIYNELIKDLLLPSSVDLKLHEDPVRGMVVQGITEYGADSANEILELLHRGNLHRSVEPTAANQVSSRSHAVLQVTVEQAEKTAHVTGNVRIGKLSMVDLAGSERASKTENRGDRLKEGANINRSLLALGNCITALADGGRSHVPFRDSKMTRLLKDSLGGNCRTVMIANISPSHRQFEETVNTLKYANRAKNLKTQVARNVMSVSAHIAEYQRIIMELRNEVADLKAAAAHGSGNNRLGPLHGLREDSRGVTERNQRLSAVDYVGNLEKQHVIEIEEAVMQACAERRGLLVTLTELTHRLMRSQGAHLPPISDGGARSTPPADPGGALVPAHGSVPGGRDGAAEDGKTHQKIIAVRKKLLSNQQDVQDIIETAVNRISSSERLQLLQLFIRGKFMEVLHEQFVHELEWRRELQQRAVSEGHLSPELMGVAMATESWLVEHRPPMDFHAKMAYVEIGGAQGMTIPSIAQLLDQNLISPQQAISAQNIGALVRPFTQQTLGKKPPSPLKLPSLRQMRGNASGIARQRSPRAETAPLPIFSLPEIRAGSADGAGSTRSLGGEHFSAAGSPRAGDGHASAGQHGPQDGGAGTILPKIAPANTQQQQALRGLKRNSAARRRRGVNGSNTGRPPGTPNGQGLESHNLGSDDGRSAMTSRSDSRGTGSPDSEPLPARASAGNARSRQRDAQRKLAISAAHAHPAPRQAQHTRTSPVVPAGRDASPPDGRFNAQPQRIRAINGVYGLARLEAERPGGGGRQAGAGRRARAGQVGAGRPAASAPLPPQRSPGRVPRGNDAVVRLVAREGLRRQDVPPAAPSQARALRLQQARDRRAGGPGRPVANPALRAVGRAA